MSDQPVSREEHDALARRVQQLEDSFDAHRIVIISAVQRVEGKVDDISGKVDDISDRMDTAIAALVGHTTLLRAIARHIGLPE
jgi:hypothetical protein